MTEGRSSSHSQSLERGLAILSAFRSGTPVLGVSELSREVGLSRSTAHRYIATLATLGYLDQDPVSRKYRLGPRVLDLGFSAINSMDVREISAPHLRRLSDETGHTVMELLRSSVVRPDRAVIVVTHDNRIFQYGDRTVHMDDGRITRHEQRSQSPAA